MDLNDIFALMDRFDEGSISALELDMAGVHLTLKKDGAPVTTAKELAPATAPISPPVTVSAPPVAPLVLEGDFIKAPLVGTFYQSSAPGKPTFATVGTSVKKGQTVCVLEAMKMMSEVPAPADCVIEAVLVEDGALVGYNAPLFRVRLV